MGTLPTWPQGMSTGSGLAQRSQQPHRGCRLWRALLFFMGTDHTVVGEETSPITKLHKLSSSMESEQGWGGARAGARLRTKDKQGG